MSNKASTLIKSLRLLKILESVITPDILFKLENRYSPGYVEFVLEFPVMPFGGKVFYGPRSICYHNAFEYARRDPACKIVRGFMIKEFGGDERLPDTPPSIVHHVWCMKEGRALECTDVLLDGMYEYRAVEILPREEISDPAEWFSERDSALEKIRAK